MPESRIHGGIDANIIQTPWAAAVLYYNVLRCGATIFQSTAVLTAASCVETVIKDEVRILAGSSFIDQFQVTYQVNDIYIHPNHIIGTQDYDIAVIFLQVELQEGESIKFISLAEPWYQLEEGTSATVAGWGVTEEGGETSNELQLGNLIIVDTAECQEAFNDVGVITVNQFCAYYPEALVDLCQYDEGVGLVANNSYLIGIYSWGNGCGNAGYPSIFTTVAYMRNWLDSILV